MRFFVATAIPAVLLLTAVIAVACGGTSPEPTPTPTPTLTPTATPSPTPTPPAAGLSEAEERYVNQVKAARALTRSKFENFSQVFSQTWPLREQLISTLLEAGVGTTFTDSLEAFQQIEPPERFRNVHTAIVAIYGELVRLDGEAADSVREGDLAGFVLANGKLGEVASEGIMALPGELCEALYSVGDEQRRSCAPTGTLPGGEYGAQLNDLLRRLEPKVATVEGVFAFPLSLSVEEMAEVLAVQVPRTLVFLEKARLDLQHLMPSDSFSADHGRLIEYVEARIGAFERISDAANSRELQGARRELQSMNDASCDAPHEFSSPDFIKLVGVHLAGPCETPPPGPPPEGPPR